MRAELRVPARDRDRAGAACGWVPRRPDIIVPMPLRILTASLLLASALAAAANAQELPGFAEFDSARLPGSRGVVVRVRHPAGWKKVEVDDDMALAELRGPQGRLTGILQIGRGRQQEGVEALCRPERARTMLQNLGAEESDVRITDVVARQHEGRPGYEIRYQRSNPPDYLQVRSLVVCLKDSRLVVSCGASGPGKAALADIEPVCRQVFDSLRISED